MKIVYESQTGFTERYANMLGKRLGIETIKLKDYPAQEEKEEIIFISWVCANSIKKYSKVKEKYNIKCIGAVGMAENTDNYTKSLITSNKTGDIPLFYLRGGVNFQKLKGLSKFIMKAITKNEIKKHKIEGDPEKVFAAGRDYVKEENLDAMSEYIKGKR